jgi:hypothetical protein
MSIHVLKIIGDYGFSLVGKSSTTNAIKPFFCCREQGPVRALGVGQDWCQDQDKNRDHDRDRAWGREGNRDQDKYQDQGDQARNRDQARGRDLD